MEAIRPGITETGRVRGGGRGGVNLPAPSWEEVNTGEEGIVTDPPAVLTGRAGGGVPPAPLLLPAAA
jgi:hypothetical protein